MPVLANSKEAEGIPFAHSTASYDTDTVAVLVDFKLARQIRGSLAPPATKWSVAHPSLSYD